MNEIWIILLILSIVVTSVFIILLFLELKRTARALNDFLKTTEGALKPTLEELQQTLKSLKNVSNDINDVTTDIKTLSGAVRDVGQNVRHVSNLIGYVTSSTATTASGLKVGVRTGLEVLLKNLLKKGDRK